jgi:hypothetical protein
VSVPRIDVPSDEDDLAMIHVKGSAISARIRYIREKHGEDGLRAVLESLSPEDRAALEGRVLASAWVSYDLFVKLNVAADRKFGRGDYRVCYEMGKYSAEVNLPSIYKLFFRFGSPLFIFRKAARVWDVHYDSGRLVPMQDGPAAVRLRVEEFAQPHRAHCMSVLGWAVKSIELSGSTVTYAEEESCRLRGGTHCEFTLRWQ